MSTKRKLDNYFDQFFKELEQSTIIKTQVDKVRLAELLRKVYDQGFYNGKIEGRKEVEKSE